MYVDWAPDSSALLLSSYNRAAVPTFTLIDPVTLSARPLPVELKEYSLAGFSPGGKYILVGRYGIITPDGKPMLEDPRLWSGFWSPDDRFLLLYGENNTFELLEVAPGARRSIPRPKNFGLVLGFAADGSAIYFAGRVTQ
jgi:hypothetical protein